MGWTINPTDPIHSWNGYDICIHTMLDDGMGISEVVVLVRKTGTTDWAGMGPADGSVWTGDFVSDMNAKGGFKPWRAALRTAIQTRIDAWAATLNPPAPIGDPKSFAEFQAWIVSNTHWADSATSTSVSFT